MGDGPGGGDLIEPCSGNASEPFNSLSSDCAEGWEVYWRQNFPGLDNQARDIASQPMLNWWPFLYY